MIVLGLDPGIDRLGWAFLKDSEEGIALLHYGLITTDKTKDSVFRLGEIASDLNQLIVTHSPDCMCIEHIFFSKNVKTAMTIAEVRGVLKVIASQHMLEVREIHPMQLKKKLVGSGKASKKEMQLVMKNLFGLVNDFKTDDVADAIAIGYVGLLEAIGQL